MSKAILISMQPKWCELIAARKKTVEVRKTKPKLETPFKVYIYCTKGDWLMKTAGNFFFIDNAYIEEENLYGLYEVLNGKVIGEFVCDWIRCEKEVADGFVDIVLESTSCVSARELVEYANGNVLYSWHISDLVIYDEPKELSEFSKSGFGRFLPLKRPPQSWMYVEKGAADEQRETAD